jgi:hypothetical protein
MVLDPAQQDFVPYSWVLVKDFFFLYFPTVARADLEERTARAKQIRGHEKSNQETPEAGQHRAETETAADRYASS